MVSVAVVSSLSCQSVERRVAEPTGAPLTAIVVNGFFTAVDLVEASGLVRSSIEPNLFWAQNDSGNDERLFAFDSTGRSRGAVRVMGAKNRDWEAIALGPCVTGSCMFIGDVGDNQARRKTVRVWRIPEPRAGDTVSQPATLLTLRYPDGPHDVEAMWVTPDSMLYLLTKRPEWDSSNELRPARMYRVAPFAWHSDTTAVAELVDSLPITPAPRNGQTWISDASLSLPDAAGNRRLAVRTYRDVYIFGVDSTTWRPTALLAQCTLTAFRTNSGEGLTWLANGRLMFDAEGRGARLTSARCDPSPDAGRSSPAAH